MPPLFSISAQELSAWPSTEATSPPTILSQTGLGSSAEMFCNVPQPRNLNNGQRWDTADPQYFFPNSINACSQLHSEVGQYETKLYSCRHASISRFASASVPNQCAFRHSARNVPLNDSMKSLSVGSPGREKSIFIPFWKIKVI